MNNVQERIVALESSGWTQTAIADEVDVTVNAVQKWKSGAAYPRNVKGVLLLMGTLLKRKPPKQRRYNGTHHLQRAKAERERQDQD